MKPFDRCRVLDLGIITAGAATSAILADLGAEVIKIESEAYKDPFRKWEGEVLDGESADLPPFFRMTNRGKANIGLDLKTKQGREIFLRLVSECDVVVENFRRGVLDRLNLSFETLKAANPDIILASISSQGEYGPDSGYVSFGSTLEAMGGLSAITGYEGGPPVVSGNELNFPDQVVAIFASSMIATAWFAKENGQGGAHLDLSQRELTSFLSGDAFVSEAGRHGNSQSGVPLQDCFLSADHHWIAVSVRQTNLEKVSALVGDSTTATLTDWIAARSKQEVVVALNAIGVSVTPVLDGVEVLAERNNSWVRAILEDKNGQLVKGTLFGDGARAPSLDKPAVHLGHDTRDVLTRIAGFTHLEIEGFLRAGVISEPTCQPQTQVKAAR